MKTITLARKPLVGTVAKNVLEYGSGGLNLDASRIACPNEKITTHSQSKGSANNRVIFEAGSEWAGIDTHQTEGQKLGRFPANLILQHLDGCWRDGVKRVKGSNPCTSGGGVANKVYGVANKVYGPYGNKPVNDFTAPDGKETIANWVCENGCPVKALDDQSGLSYSSGGSAKAGRFSGLYGTFSGENSGASVGGFGDIGGASRFFKQIGEDK